MFITKSFNIDIHHLVLFSFKSKKNNKISTFFQYNTAYCWSFIHIQPPVHASMGPILCTRFITQRHELNIVSTWN